MHINIERLKKDLFILRDDIELITKKHNLVDDQRFIQKIAHDIRKIDEDSFYLKDNEKAQLIHYLLSSPVGAPFVTPISLLEAAKTLKRETPLESRLHHYLENLLKYSDEEHFPLALWIDDIAKSLH